MTSVQGLLGKLGPKKGGGKKVSSKIAEIYTWTFFHTLYVHDLYYHHLIPHFKTQLLVEFFNSEFAY